MTVGQVAVLAVVGLVAGVAGGMLGIGGSIVFIPALGLLFPGVGYGLYSATALICNVFVGLGAAIGHWRHRRVIPQVVRLIVPLGVVAALGGVFAANCLERYGLDKVLWGVFGLVVCQMILDNVRKMFQRAPPVLTTGDAVDGRRVNLVRALPAALPAGLLAGLLGIGGGAYSVPSQQMFLDMPQKNAIANSSVTMVVFCAIAAVVKNATGLPAGVSHWEPVALAGWLVPSAILGALVGSRLTHALPERLVRGLFLAFLGWTAYQCFFEKVKVAELLGGWLGV